MAIFWQKIELEQSCHVLTTKVATSQQLKLPSKNVWDDMLKFRTFGIYLFRYLSMRKLPTILTQQQQVVPDNQ